jgi:hypothetical protein
MQGNIVMKHLDIIALSRGIFAVKEPYRIAWLVQ